MATLIGQKVNDSIGDLVQVSNSGSGIDGTLRQLEDGTGTASALYISTSAISCAIGTLTTFTSTTATIGTATITTGNITTANVTTLSISTPLALSSGGTNANLTASNGGIFYSTATAGAILSGTATAGKLLRSGSSAAPTWTTPTFPNTGTDGKILIGDGTNYVESTPTYPRTSPSAGLILRSDGTNIIPSTSTFADTYGASTILYSNGANTVTGLATANNGVLITSGTGVPSISSTIPSATQDNITRTGTITSGTWTGTTIAVANGGTGVTSSDPVIQKAYSIVLTAPTGSTTIPLDDTIPQNTEGTEFITCSITPKNAANILTIDVLLNFGSSASVVAIMALFQDSTASAIDASWITISANTEQQIRLRHKMAAGTTSATTFKVRLGPSTAATFTLNGAASSRYLGGVLSSSIHITETAS